MPALDLTRKPVGYNHRPLAAVLLRKRPCWRQSKSPRFWTTVLWPSERASPLWRYCLCKQEFSMRPDALVGDPEAIPSTPAIQAQRVRYAPPKCAASPFSSSSLLHQEHRPPVRIPPQSGNSTTRRG